MSNDIIFNEALPQTEKPETKSSLAEPAKDAKEFLYSGFKPRESAFLCGLARPGSRFDMTRAGGAFARKLLYLSSVLCLLTSFFFLSAAFAAPHITKGKPEPVERPGMHIGKRLAKKFGAAHILAAPAAYPATVKILFLKVDFVSKSSTTIDPTAPTNYTGDGTWTDATYAPNTPPVYGDPDYWVTKAENDFITYFTEVSYGQLTVQITVTPSVYHLPHKMSSYGDESDAALKNLIIDSVNAADADINFSQYDAILIVHAGAGEESDTAGVTGDTPNDIWSLHYSSSGTIVTADGVNISGAIIMPQTDSQDGNIVDPLGVYVHEFGHWLGLPDLYCTNLICFLDGVGDWSLMGDGIYNRATPADPYGSSPAHLDAWSKVYLGWVTPQALTTTPDPGNTSLNPVETNQTITKLPASTSGSTQYFLLENRQKTGFDQGLPGHGLLVWLIDQTVVDNNLAGNSVNNSALRPGVKLVEADADGALMTYGGDTGSQGDPFPGSHVVTKLTPVTTPSSNPYTQDGWVNLKNINENTGTVTLDIGFGPHPPQNVTLISSGTITWSAYSESDPAVTFNVYKGGVLATTTPLAAPPYTDTAPQGGAVYQVSGIDAAGNESTFSSSAVQPVPPVNGEGGGGGSCFIATAAYGSSLDPHVEALRKFRDRYLLTNRAGRAFAEAYYHYSPPVADFIGRHESLRMVMRWMLTPVVYAVEYPGVFFLFCGIVMVVMTVSLSLRVRKRRY